MNDLLGAALAGLAGELVHPQLAIRGPKVDQGHQPPAIADHNFAGTAKRRRRQDGEGDLAAGPPAAWAARRAGRQCFPGSAPGLAPGEAQRRRTGTHRRSRPGHVNPIWLWLGARWTIDALDG